MKKLTLFVVALVFLGFALYAIAAPLLTEDQAINLLMTKIKEDKLYSSWTTMDCLMFILENQDKEYFEFGIHERHGGKCPGDPATSPIVDRFRVSRITKKIEWYKPTEGEWSPYEGVKQIRLKK